MKRWQNNWEKSIGNKLRQAESTPENHVWELLEMELDAHKASSKNTTYKLAAIAAIMLLFAGSFSFLSSVPNAELANFSNDINITDPQQNYYSELPSAVESYVKNTESPQADLVIESSMPLDPIVQASVNRLDKVAGIRTNDLTQLRINEINKISDQFYTNVVDRRHSANAINRESLTIAEATDKAPFVNNYALEFFRNQKDHVLDRTFGLESDLPVNIAIAKQELSELLVKQQTNQLAGQKVDLKIANFVIKDQDLARNTDLETLLTDLEMLMDNEAEMSATTSSVTQNWQASAMEEFNTWQNDISEEEKDVFPDDIDKEILEELIEEAELDKEDPLTILKEEANDLYYAKSIHKGLHFGLVTGVQNTWVTKASRNPEITRNYTKNLFTPGYQIGLNVGYDFTKHLGLVAELKYSDEGMRFHNPITQNTEHLDLKYLEIPVYLKGKHFKMSGKMKPLVFNYLLGINFSDLRSVDSYVNGDSKRFAQDYNTSEWGIVAGFDFDYYVNKNLFLTVGTRAGVNGNSDNFPRLASNTGALNYSIGLYTRINFRLPAR